MPSQREEIDPYHKWLGIPKSQQPPTFYRLLGIELFEDNPDVIAAAASRQVAYLHQLTSGPHRRQTQKLMNEIAQARRTLSDDKARAQYDEKLRAKLPADGAKVDPPPPPQNPPAHTSAAPEIDLGFAAPKSVSSPVINDTSSGSFPAIKLEDQPKPKPNKRTKEPKPKRSAKAQSESPKEKPAAPIIVAPTSSGESSSGGFPAIKLDDQPKQKPSQKSKDAKPKRAAKPESDTVKEKPTAQKKRKAKSSASQSDDAATAKRQAKKDKPKTKQPAAAEGGDADEGSEEQEKKPRRKKRKKGFLAEQ